MSEAFSYRRRHSLFGPILIAAIGVFFLLHNFGLIATHNLGWWFARYWPLLLIIWGAVKFLEYLWARQRNEAYAGVGSGGVILMIMIIVFGLSASAASRINWNWLDIDSGGDWSDGLGIFGERYDFTDNFAQSMPDATQIKVLSDHGEITVTPSADNQAHVLIHKYIRSRSHSEANQFNDSTHAKFQQQGTVWLLDLTSGDFSQGRFDVVLQAPPKFPISVLARHGDVHVSQIQADTEIEVDHGDIEAEDIGGLVILHPHQHDVTVRNVKGDLTIEGDTGDNTISNIGGTVTFDTGVSGDIDLSRIAGSLHFKSSRTDLQIAKLDGNLKMDGSDLNADSIIGPFVLTTRTKDVHLEEVTGNIHIDDPRGDIEVRTKAPIGNVDISTSGGEINISLPERPGFQVEAESANGEIQSDFGLSINDQNNTATASGKVGQGGAQVRLKTSKGTIQIHKAG